MTETVTDTFNEGVQKTLRLKSSTFGLFGSKFRADIPVTDLGNGYYKITKDDWDATVGPIFDRMKENIENRNRLDADKYRAIAHGYVAMDSEQTEQFHHLLVAFGCAADPARLEHYPGTPQTNGYLRYCTDFTKLFNSPEQAILVTQTQLQSLTEAARGAMEYAREGMNVAQKAKEFFKAYDFDRDRVKYTNGLLNALT